MAEFFAHVDHHRRQVQPSNHLTVGTAPHCATQLWAVIYPIDMIKSHMQTDGFSPATGQKYTGAWHAFRTVLATEGPAAFTRGLIPTLIRYA